MDNKEVAHPRLTKHLPYLALLAVAGFDDFDVFKPLQNTFRLFEERGGYKIIAEILRPSSMYFLLEEGIYRNRKKDMVLEALETAGNEIIRFKKVSRKTKKTIEQKLRSKPMYISASNILMDKMIQEKKLLFQRNL